MKLLDIFESFFHPELPGPRNAHQFRKGNTKQSCNDFPYMDQDEEQRVSEEDIEKELGIDEE